MSSKYRRVICILPDHINKDLNMLSCNRKSKTLIYSWKFSHVTREMEKGRAGRDDDEFIFQVKLCTY